MIWGFFFLPESLRKEPSDNFQYVWRLNPLKQFGQCFGLAQFALVAAGWFFYGLHLAILLSN